MGRPGMSMKSRRKSAYAARVREAAVRRPAWVPTAHPARVKKVVEKVVAEGKEVRRAEETEAGWYGGNGGWKT